MSRTISLAITFHFFTLFAQAAPQKEPWPQAINKVPEWANALVLVDYQGILASPIALKENWDKLLPQDVIGTTVPIPRNTQTVVLAAHLEPGTLKSRRDLALIQGGPFAPFAQVAKLEQAGEEAIAGVPVLLTARNSYILSMSPRQLAVYSPANRQDVARWIRFTQNNKDSVISNYLQQSTQALNDGYHIVISIDLHDTVDPNLARQFVTHSPLLRGKKFDADALVKVLTSSRGIRIGIRFDQAIKATLAGDFNENIQSVASVLPGLILASMEDLGAELEEFPANSAKVQNKSFLVTSTLTQRGLQKVMNLFAPLQGPVLVQQELPPPGKEPGNNVIQANQQYLKSIRDMANEAHTTAEKKNDMILAAQAYERAALRIDQLGVLNIDEDLVKFSTFASSRLRSISDALRSAMLEANAVESGRKYNIQYFPGTFTGSYNLGPWNPQSPGDPFSPPGLWIRPQIIPPTYNVQTNDAEIQGKQAEVLAKGAKQRLELWRQLSDETANLRKKLTIKYKVDF